jgi:hypothetical protein
VPEDRISKLSQRFKTHAVGRKPTSNRTRERRSLYLDGELVERLDKIYKDVNHELYPNGVNKSAFLETLLEYGLDNLTEVKLRLAAVAASDTAPSS